MEITNSAIETYVALHKAKFGSNFAKLIEELLFDEMNMQFEIPKTWDHAAFAAWAKMDLLWLAAEEGGVEIVDATYAQEVFASNVEHICGIEDYFIV